MNVYPLMYLSKAQATLGDAFDYGINIYGVTGSDFVKLFLVSSVSKRLEMGDTVYLLGKSGIEVALDIFEEAGMTVPVMEPSLRYGRSREYWIGWILAYYQWCSGLHYGEIFRLVSFEDMEKMYEMLHEADPGKFRDILDARRREGGRETRLREMRRRYGLTQAALAERSGVSLRSIQMYEQRNKDINKAGAETVYRLSKVMGCRSEDLLER